MVYLDEAVRFDQTGIRNETSEGYIEKKLFRLRRAVNDLFFRRHFSKAMIAAKKKVSRNFVLNWTRSPDQTLTEDHRGWPLGKRRKWSRAVEQRIKHIHDGLVRDPLQFYTGATVIEQHWRARYPHTPPPPLRTIGRILADLGLSERRKRDKVKGASRYLCYPEYTIYHRLGGRVLEADFIGKKYIAGRTEPVNFIGFSFKKAPKFRYFKRVDGQTADSFIEQAGCVFERFEKPDFIKVDNALAMIGSSSGKRNISRAMAFLLRNQVIPIFAVPKKPFSQASIEGNNSVFSRKFWNRIDFKNLRDIDEKLEWFNKSSQQYTGYQHPNAKPKRKRNFIPKVYFIRQVKDDQSHIGKASIDVLHEKIFLPKSYINYFVLAKWNLASETLSIYFEKERKSKMIKRLSFPINPRSKQCTKIA